MKIQFITDKTWAQGGKSHKASKGDVLEVTEGLAEILIRLKAAKKYTVKKKATK